MMEDEVVCYCSNITKRQILEAVKHGAGTLQDVQRMTTACTAGNCQEKSPKKRCCSADIIKILNEVRCETQ